MKRIVAKSRVYWDSGDKELTGVVKQIMSDHVSVKADSGEYIVRKALLRDKSKVIKS